MRPITEISTALRAPLRVTFKIDSAETVKKTASKNPLTIVNSPGWVLAGPRPWPAETDQLVMRLGDGGTNPCHQLGPQAGFFYFSRQHLLPSNPSNSDGLTLPPGKRNAGCWF